MIFYKTQQMAQPRLSREFDNAADAIRAALSYDHEYEVYLMDSQGSGDVKVAYCWLNKIHLSSMAPSDFVEAANHIARDWPYRIA